jgi:hypothetical protein
MKKLFSVLLIVIAVSTQAQTTQESKPIAPETLVLKQVSHDFGKIQQGRPVTHLFEVTNTGKEPMRIENVQASCGCTTPEWSSEAINPGGSTTIKVGYNAASEGPFQKSVTIQYNGNQTKTILISGTVFKAAATSAPANSSISLLKQTNQ